VGRNPRPMTPIMPREIACSPSPLTMVVLEPAAAWSRYCMRCRRPTHVPIYSQVLTVAFMPWGSDPYRRMISSEPNSSRMYSRVELGGTGRSVVTWSSSVV
jgi:hypothetical protein